MRRNGGARACNESRGRGRAAALALACVFWMIPAARGHAVLQESTPAAHAKLNGANSPVRLKFNLRVDGKRSRLILIRPDRTTQTIALESQPSPSELIGALGNLAAGDYVIRWQVLADDGHISRGEVPFAVVAVTPPR